MHSIIYYCKQVKHEPESLSILSDAYIVVPLSPQTAKQFE